MLLQELATWCWFRTLTASELQTGLTPLGPFVACAPTSAQPLSPGPRSKVSCAICWMEPMRSARHWTEECSWSVERPRVRLSPRSLLISSDGPCRLSLMSWSRRVPRRRRPLRICVVTLTPSPKNGISAKATSPNRRSRQIAQRYERTTPMPLPKKQGDMSRGQPNCVSTFRVICSICGSRAARPCAQSVDPDVITLAPASFEYAPNTAWP